MRHIRLAEIQCFDPKVFILTFAFVHVYYAFTTLVTRVAKETSTCVPKKFLKLHKVKVAAVLKIRNILVCYAMPIA